LNQDFDEASSFCVIFLLVAAFTASLGRRAQLEEHVGEDEREGKDGLGDVQPNHVVPQDSVQAAAQTEASGRFVGQHRRDRPLPA
jgi:hypothetical protein